VVELATTRANDGASQILLLYKAKSLIYQEKFEEAYIVLKHINYNYKTYNPIEIINELLFVIRILNLKSENKNYDIELKSFQLKLKYLMK